MDVRIEPLYPALRNCVAVKTGSDHMPSPRPERCLKRSTPKTCVLLVSLKDMYIPEYELTHIIHHIVSLTAMLETADLRTTRLARYRSC